MYQAHPSHALSDIFRSKPYQGAPPEQAEFLFVGLDANYSANIEQNPTFPSILQYHEDGPAFWRRHGVHHPFLLPEYPGCGRRYHPNFAKIGFQAVHADRVSFVELFHLPTVGRSRLEPRDLERSHLQQLREAIFAGEAKYVFVSAGVLRLMGTTGAFRELLGAPISSGVLRVLFRDSRRTVFHHLHFSNYGKFEAQLQAEAKEIAGLLRDDTQLKC